MVERLGDRGSLLTADEIAKVLRNYRIRYGTRILKWHDDGEISSSVRHLDVIS